MFYNFGLFFKMADDLKNGGVYENSYQSRNERIG